jgi:signal transduction histidine kinase
MNSFTTRVTARFALLVTVLATIVLLAGGLLLHHQMEHGLDLLHEVEGKELAELLGDRPGLTAAEVEQRIMHDADGDAALFFIQVTRADEVVYRSDNLGDAILPMDFSAGAYQTTRVPFLGRMRLFCTVAGPWRIVIGSPMASSERLLRDYIWIALGLVVMVAVASVALGYAFSRDTFRPLRAIEATARRIRADNLGERITVSGRDEIAALTVLLNETFDRLQSSFEQVRRFSADVSHELKTPLALLRLNAEKLRPRLAQDPDAAAALDDMLEEMAQMNQVIERLLFIARSESGAVAIDRRTVALRPWLEAFAEDARVLAEDRRVVFRLGEIAAGEVQVDADLWRQLLLNLVTNAVAVSPALAVVTLQVERRDSAMVFSVSDEGPGLPEDQLARVFERFVRLKPAGGEATASRGHGLGLAICKAIVELHGGTIQAVNRRDTRGLRMEVRLPVA